MSQKPLWFRIIQYTMTFILTVVVTGLVVGFVGIGTAAGFVASLVKDQDILSKKQLAQDIQQFSQTSYIMDREGKRIGSGELRTADDRELVSLDEVSPHLIDAFISTEDKEFYEHNGIVPRSLLRAAIQDFSGSDTTTGGSTITQQLVKLSVLRNPEQTYSRKAKEIFLALRLERLFDKDEILTSYLNRIYFGQGASHEHLYGVEAAAQGIFDVSAAEVNIAQAAYLAGIPQRPNAYSPFEEETLQAGIERQQTVLRRMLENGTITDEEYEEAQEFDIQSTLAEGKEHMYEQYPYLFEAIHERTALALMVADEIDIDDLEPEQYEEQLAEYKQRAAEGGYRIHTTIDMNLYDALNKVVRDYKGYKPDVEVEVKGIEGKITAKEQIGSALIHTETGELLAFVGGRDKKSLKNRALSARKQPGSSAKPLLAYGPGMASGVLQPGTILDDSEKTARGPGGHTYGNYTGRFYGPVTAREALKNSYNVASVDAFRKVGVQNGYDFIAQMNMPVEEKFRVESGVLGSVEFTPEQMAAAYATFGNHGKFNEPYLISRIENAEGEVIYEHEQKTKEVMSPQSAYLLTDVLRDVLRSGTGTYVGGRIGGYDVAGKTGTTQESKDVWFVGYTPKIALSVWVGYDYERSTPTVRPNDNLARIMWAEFFNTIQATAPDLSPAGTRFKQPGGIVSAHICDVSGKQATEYCKAAGHAYTELFQSGKAPKDKCDLHDEDYVSSLLPSAPSGLKAEYTERGVHLSWKANPEEDEVNHYLIFADSKQIAKVTGTSHTHAGSFTGERTYYVKAVNDYGSSPASNTITIAGDPSKGEDPPSNDDDGDDKDRGNDDDSRSGDGHHDDDDQGDDKGDGDRGHDNPGDDEDGGVDSGRDSEDGSRTGQLNKELSPSFEQLTHRSYLRQSIMMTLLLLLL